MGTCAFDAIHQAGVRRFRPILLTTLTTFGGLTPMIFETSRQARFLIPMAVSICFGLLIATVLTLLYVPALFLIVADITNVFAGRWTENRGQRTDKNNKPVSILGHTKTVTIE